VVDIIANTSVMFYREPLHRNALCMHNLVITVDNRSSPSSDNHSEEYLQTHLDSAHSKLTEEKKRSR